MNYELAKELKDAGFPHHKKGMHHLGCRGLFANNEQVCSITLEELIEACGNKFGDLTLINTGTGDCWFANSYGLPAKTASTTPTEAVAKLWLALNKKS